jgi:hypothetical protein
MTLNIAAVRAAVKVALAGIDGLEVFTYRAVRPQLPAAILNWSTIDPNLVFSPRHWTHHFEIQLLVGGADDAAADDAHTALLAEDGSVNDSVIVALRADPTFGGACQTSNIVQFNNDGWIEFADGAIVALGCTIELEVIT